MAHPDSDKDGKPPKSNIVAPPLKAGQDDLKVDAPLSVHTADTGDQADKIKKLLNDDIIFGSSKNEFIEIELDYILQLTKLKNSTDNKGLLVTKIEEIQQITNKKLILLFNKVLARCKNYI
jgi:hypothetical protein